MAPAEVLAKALLRPQPICEVGVDPSHHIHVLLVVKVHHVERGLAVVAREIDRRGEDALLHAHVVAIGHDEGVVRNLRAEIINSVECDGVLVLAAGNSKQRRVRPF